MNRLKVMLAMFFFIMVPSVYAQPVLQILYLVPTDVDTPDQEELNLIVNVVTASQLFYATEMERLGFGPKTFNFNKEVLVVQGTLNLKDYVTISDVRNAIPQEEFGSPNNIQVVFLAGATRFQNVAGIMQPLCLVYPGKPQDPKFCNHLAIIATEFENRVHIEPITAHEIGHTFGLPHVFDDENHLMYYTPVVYKGVEKKLDEVELSMESAKILNDSYALVERPDLTNPSTEIDADINNNPKEDIALTFEYNSENSLTPINPSSEWDGWVIGVWEKTLDGIIPPKSQWYFNFPEMGDLSHWMYSHAPSRIEYNLSDREFESFGAYFILPHIALNDPKFCTQGMNFIAHADGVEIYSKDMYLADYGTYIEFEIPEGTKHLTLTIGDLGDMTCDHYVLGEPKLFKKGESPLTEINADVNKDGYIDLYDVMIVRSGMSGEVSYDTDLNDDGITDEVDLLIVKAKAMEAIVAAAPRKRKVNITTWGSMKSR